MRVCFCLAAVPNLVLRFHKRPFLLRLFVFFRSFRRRATASTATALTWVIVCLVAHLHALCRRRVVVVHGAQCLADAEKQIHEVPLGEFGVVDEVGVDHILEVAAAVVRQQDIDSFGGFISAALGRNGVVGRGDDVGDVSEEAVGFDLAHGLLDGLGAERAANLFKGEVLLGGRVFDKVDI